MEYTIEVRKSYIYIKVTGQISTMRVSGWGEINSALKSVVNKLKKTNIHKLLIDCLDISGKISTLDRYLLAVFFVKENSRLNTDKMHPLRITFVLNKSFIDPGRFGETVARNRGLYGFVTDNMQEAVHWLEKDAPSEEKS